MNVNYLLIFFIGNPRMKNARSQYSMECDGAFDNAGWLGPHGSWLIERGGIGFLGLYIFALCRKNSLR